MVNCVLPFNDDDQLQVEMSLLLVMYQEISAGVVDMIYTLVGNW